MSRSCVRKAPALIGGAMLRAAGRLTASIVVACFAGAMLCGCGPSGSNSGGGAANRDSDGDRLDDTLEKTIGSDPRLRDTDGDGLDDGDEYDECPNATDADPDRDGLTDYDETVSKWAFHFAIGYPM